MKRFLLLLLLPITTLLLGIGGWGLWKHLKTTSKISLIRKLEQESQKKVFPAFAVQELIVNEQASPILPFTGPAKSQTVFCRENHDYLVYETDRHGFHNPDQIWDEPQWDSVFLGDSFVQGACVASQSNFVRLYEKENENKNGPAGSLGSYGNGPLSQLATLIEYAAQKRPKKIFWVYTPNDLFIDLSLESQNLVLMDYLQGKSQNLMQRQSEVDSFLSEFLEKSKMRQDEDERSKRLNWKEFFSFLSKPKAHPYSDLFHQSKANWSLYESVLKKAVEISQGWGGEFYFVILTNGDMLIPENQVQALELRHRLREIASRWPIRVLDFYDDFQKVDRPLSLFEELPGRYGHFNARGYELMARFLVQATRAN